MAFGLCHDQFLLTLCGIASWLRLSRKNNYVSISDRSPPTHC